MNNTDSTERVITIGTPGFTDDEIRGAQRIIDAAASDPAEAVHVGTPEWDVLVRFGFNGDESKALNFTEGDPANAWLSLIGFVHPSPAWETSCPSWCTTAQQGFRHPDDTTRDGNLATSHSSESYGVGDMQLALTRDDIRSVDGTVTKSTSIMVGDVDMTLDEARALIGTLQAGLSKIEDAYLAEVQA